MIQLILAQQEVVEDISAVMLATAVRVGLVIGVTFLVYLVISRFIELYGKKKGLDRREKRQVKSIFKYVTLGFGFLGLLYAFGLDPAVVLAGAGVLTVVVSVSTHDIINNFVSGLILILSKNFVVNDVVKVGDTYGIIRIINVRSTQIRTFDGNIVTVPNSTMANSTVINMTSGSDFMLTSIWVGISYDEDLHKVTSIMQNAIPDDDRIHIEEKSDLRFEFKEIENDRVLGIKVVMYFKVDALQEPWIRSKVKSHVTKALTREKMKFQKETQKEAPG